MSRFYGTLEGARGKVTKQGTTNSGLVSMTASYKGAVRVTVYDHEGEDWARVELTQWEGEGAHPAIELYDGPVSGRGFIDPFDIYQDIISWANKVHPDQNDSQLLGIIRKCCDIVEGVDPALRDWGGTKT